MWIACLKRSKLLGQLTLVNCMPPIAEDPELIQAFLVESHELLQAVDHDLVSLESAPANQELLNRTFRALHTIKGTASFLGFEPMVRVGHAAENVLSGLREGRLQLTRRAMDSLLAARDHLGTMLDDLRAGGLKDYALRALLNELELVQSGKALPAATVSQEATQAREAPASPVTVEAQASENKTVAAKPVLAAAQSMRVDVRKLDELIGMIGELVLERNRLLRLTKEINGGRGQVHDTDSPLTHCALRLSFITEEIQAAGLRTRMVPMETVFAKFPRMVRDLAHSLGKEVELELRGQDTEIDKTMVELVSDPLIHLIRNSLDHGLELPAVREQQGKPRCGKIRLEAEHEGDHVLIRVSDDGAGINSERVLRKAVDKSFVSTEQAARLTTKEIYEFIFLPGFSTVENPTELSGRGVGMDVVRSNLKKINGSIELDSRPSKGTTVSLRVPLTLAILPVLLVRVAHEIYALPLRCIEQTACFIPGDAHRVEDQEVIWMGTEPLPLLRLHDLFSVLSLPAEGQKLVVLGAAEKRVALLVDGLVGQESTVVTPLTPYLSHCAGIAGTTVDGDGRVRLVLDPAGLVAAAPSRQAAAR
jgi:two-component system, chemotaxis family, sensor kinase CheA